MQIVALLLAAWSIAAATPPGGFATAIPAGAATLMTLHWTGTARVFAGEEEIRIGVDSTIVPFCTARSETWLLDKGRSTARAMIITAAGGELERNGTRTPMSAAMLLHERQQYAIYGLLQLAIRNRSSELGGWSNEVPRTRFVRDRKNWPLRAYNRVSDADGKAPMVDQEFRFEGRVRSGSFAWPKTIEIRHSGRPYFRLEIDRLEVGKTVSASLPAECRKLRGL